MWIFGSQCSSTDREKTFEAMCVPLPGPECGHFAFDQLRFSAETEPLYYYLCMNDVGLDGQGYCCGILLPCVYIRITVVTRNLCVPTTNQEFMTAVNVLQ